MLMTMTPEQRWNPYPIYKSMRETAPVQFDETLHAWLVLDHENVRRVLSDQATFSVKCNVAQLFTKLIEGFPPFINAMDGPAHAQMRRPLMRPFAQAAIAQSEQAIREIVNVLIDQVIGSGTMNFIADFGEMLPVAVITRMLGLPAKDQLQLKRWSDQFENAVQLDAFGQYTGEHDQALLDFYNFLAAVAEERRRQPRQDWVSDLTTAELDGNGISTSQIVWYVIPLLIAGFHTMTHTLGNAFRILVARPEDLERLRAEPAQLPCAIEEVLRFETPGRMLPRIATRDVELGGRHVQAGERILAVQASANRDEMVFPDPDRFDIARTPNPHVAFGYGAHFCIGASLARLETRVALEVLLDRLHDLKRADDKQLELIDGIFLNGIKELSLSFRPGTQRGGAL